MQCYEIQQNLSFITIFSTRIKDNLSPFTNTSFFFFPQIQELDYRITVALRSDARSAVEGLRWILVRRAAIALAVLALMILATLKYSSYMTHTQEIERQKLKESLNAASHRQIQNQNQSDDNSPRSDMSQVEDQAQAQNNNGDEEEILARTQDSDGPGYVSLG